MLVVAKTITTSSVLCCVQDCIHRMYHSWFGSSKTVIVKTSAQIDLNTCSSTNTLCDPCLSWPFDDRTS